jgi:hypothetical protein
MKIEEVNMSELWATFYEHITSKNIVFFIITSMRPSNFTKINEAFEPSAEENIWT